MINTDKVLIGLGQHISGRTLERCGSCPYFKGDSGYGVSCRDELLDDLYEMLEAQEPRVMTLEELEDWDGAVFFEAFETDMYYVLIETVETSAGMKGSYVFINVEPGEHHRRVWDGEHYGSIWRCWTSRPNEEQRKAVKWE